MTEKPHVIMILHETLWESVVSDADSYGAAAATHAPLDDDEVPF